MDYSKLNVFQLKKELKDRNCSTQGKKEDLIHRLMANKDRPTNSSKMSRQLRSHQKCNSDECTPRMLNLTVALEILDSETIKAYLSSISAVVNKKSYNQQLVTLPETKATKIVSAQFPETSKIKPILKSCVKASSTKSSEDATSCVKTSSTKSTEDATSCTTDPPSADVLVEKAYKGINDDNHLF